MHAADEIRSEDEGALQDRNYEKIAEFMRRDFLRKLEIAARDHVCGKEHLNVSAPDDRHRSSSNGGRA